MDWPSTPAYCKKFVSQQFKAVAWIATALGSSDMQSKSQQNSCVD